jgi:hypothetical protein
MYQNTVVIEAIRTLAGIRQNDNPNFSPIADDLLYDGTNVLIQHPLLNIENLDLCARNYGFYNFPAYVAGTTYAINARIRDANVVYDSLQDDNIGNTPATSPLFWKPVNLLSLYLEDVYHNAAEDVVNEVFNEKKINRQTKTLLKSMRLYEGSGVTTDRIMNEGDFVGVYIQLLQKNNILAVVEQIGLQLTAAQDLTIYLFHESQQEAIATVTIHHTKVISFQWHDLKFKLNYMTDDYDAGGAFFIMYDQDELVGQAVKKQYNFHISPCGYCGTYNLQTYGKYSKYLYIQAVRVKAADRNGVDLWDISKTQRITDNNFGMNFQFTVQCDVTNFLVQQKDVFKFAFRDMVTKKLLENLSNSTRQNVGQEKASTMARNELMGTFAGGMGFQQKLTNQMKAVDFELSDLDDLCLPCNKQGGIYYGTAGLSRGQ